MSWNSPSLQVPWEGGQKYKKYSPSLLRWKQKAHTDIQVGMSACSPTAIRLGICQILLGNIVSLWCCVLVGAAEWLLISMNTQIGRIFHLNMLSLCYWLWWEQSFVAPHRKTLYSPQQKQPSIGVRVGCIKTCRIPKEPSGHNQMPPETIQAYLKESFS